MTEQSVSPALPLAKLLINKQESSELLIVTGPSGAGKSSYCLQLADQARSSALIVGGLISPPVFKDGRKAGIDLVDQLTGKRRRLALRQNGPNAGPRTTRWLFDPEVLAWGDRQLACLPPCDLLILDELGPLEFNQGQGFQAGLKLIDQHQLPLVVAVIRPTLLPLAQERWPWAELLVLGKETVVER